MPEPAALPDGQLVRFGKGSTIYSEGDAASCWFTVVGGVVRTCRYDASGARQVTAFLYPGDVLGLELVEHRDWAEAISDVSLWRMDRPSIEPTPAQAEFISEALRRALDSAQRSIIITGRRVMTERLAAFLVMTAERLPSADHVDLPMTRADIADYLGTNIFTISRCFAELAKDRVVAVRGTSCRVLDPARLHALAGGSSDER